MTPERWQQIHEVLHGAMQVPVAERSAFLDTKCSNDPALRSEVESFLSAEGEVSREFLERPIAQDISYAPGTRLGPYEIVAFIGAEGMAEVYKAQETRLGRTVAIKVLPTHLSSSSQHNERFQREARGRGSRFRSDRNDSLDFKNGMLTNCTATLLPLLSRATAEVDDVLHKSL